MPQYKEKPIENNDLSAIDVPFERKNITNENSNELDKNTDDENEKNISEVENNIVEKEDKEADTVDDDEKKEVNVFTLDPIDDTSSNT